MRQQLVSRKKVFELLQEIRSKAALPGAGIDGQLAVVHHIEAVIDRFIYEDDPFAPPVETRRAGTPVDTSRPQELTDTIEALNKAVYSAGAALVAQARRDWNMAEGFVKRFNS